MPPRYIPPPNLLLIGLMDSRPLAFAEYEKGVKMLSLSQFERTAVRGWMEHHGYPFDVAYQLVSREGRYPPVPCQIAAQRQRP
ncbi:hypothetical protein GO986_17860 [Deinococcus sp. HMF7620]|uniref:Uncharacterized protein n=2 Tax=Deinococcus arboris TaxID=2682977 RepID=A0A7C9M8I9_9DEIO|nr:hypothetical protein [Deinococcus arboris]